MLVWVGLRKKTSRITFLRNGLDASWKWFVYLRHNMLCHHVINSTQPTLVVGDIWHFIVVLKCRSYLRGSLWFIHTILHTHFAITIIFLPTCAYIFLIWCMVSHAICKHHKSVMQNILIGSLFMQYKKVCKPKWKSYIHRPVSPYRQRRPKTSACNFSLSKMCPM